MKKMLFLSAFCLMYAAQSKGTIHNVPNDYGSIQQAIDAAVNGDTVLVEPDTYLENIRYQGKNIVIGSLFLTSKDTSMISRTIFDGSANGPVVTVYNKEDSGAKLIGFTIRNGRSNYGGGIYIKSASLAISHCVVIDNTAESANGMGGGLHLANSQSTLFGCEIMHNSAIGMDNINGWGGGIAVLSNSNASIVNCRIHHNQATHSRGGVGVSDAVAKIIGCEITNNSSYGGGAGIGFQDSDLRIVNSTIANNKVTLKNSSALYFIRSSPVLNNCIIWYNSSDDVYNSINGWDGAPEIFYSNIQGGFDTLSVMDLEPMFADKAAGDFRLQEASPCLDAGALDTTGLNLPAYDFYGNSRLQDGNNDGIKVIDMGAYEYGPQSVPVETELSPNRPNTFLLKQNYPNPFNSSTRISYYLPVTTEVHLSIYNTLGEKIITLVNDRQAKGNHSITWTGIDRFNQKVASGIYLYRLKTGKTLLNRKMIVLEWRSKKLYSW